MPRDLSWAMAAKRRDFYLVLQPIPLICLTNS